MRGGWRLSAHAWRAILVAALGGTRGIPLIAQRGNDRLRADIEWLASDRLAGRRPGDPGADSAAAYIARRFAALQLLPLGDSSAVCETGDRTMCASYHQRVTASSPELARLGYPRGVTSDNVIAMVRGSDQALERQYVVIGAHYDHLGRSPAGALDPDSKNAIRNGADDNASGVAALLELARRIAAAPARRSVIFVAFTGEELGLVGSRWFLTHAPAPADSFVVMLNFDMVGRLRDTLRVHGGRSSTLGPVLERARTIHSITLDTRNDGSGFADQLPFVQRGIPSMHFFTGLHGDYHRATDDAHLVNVEGEARIVDYAELVIRALGDAQERPPRLAPRR